MANTEEIAEAAETKAAEEETTQENAAAETAEAKAEDRAEAKSEQSAETKSEDRAEENTAVSREEFDNLVSIVNGHTVDLDELNKIKDDYSNLASWARLAGITDYLNKSKLGPFDVVSITKDGKPCEVPSSLFSSSSNRSNDESIVDDIDNDNDLSATKSGQVNETIESNVSNETIVSTNAGATAVAPQVQAPQVQASQLQTPQVQVPPMQTRLYNRPVLQEPKPEDIAEVYKFFKDHWDDREMDEPIEALKSKIRTTKNCDEGSVEKYVKALFRGPLSVHFARQMPKFRSTAVASRFGWLLATINNFIGTRYINETTI